MDDRRVPGAWVVFLLCIGACGAQSTPEDDPAANGGGGYGASTAPPPEPSSCEPGSYLAYTYPGCGDDVHRTCLSSAAGACASGACSCDGRQITGSCNRGFSERFTASNACIKMSLAPPPSSADAGAMPSDADAGIGTEHDLTRCPNGDCDCFSPVQNIARAYQSGTRGCVCSKDGANLCLDGASLLCQRGHWLSGADGACARVDACVTVTNDLQACYARYPSCAEQRDGKFCAREP
jgi:hypothetical protein